MEGSNEIARLAEEIEANRGRLQQLDIIIKGLEEVRSGFPKGATEYIQNRLEKRYVEYDGVLEKLNEARDMLCRLIEPESGD